MPACPKEGKKAVVSIQTLMYKLVFFLDRTRELGAGGRSFESFIGQHSPLNNPPRENPCM